jgi:hypothetical protein
MTRTLHIAQDQNADALLAYVTNHATWTPLIIHCAQCHERYPPAAKRCPNCGAADPMIGTHTPSGMLVSGLLDRRESGRESPFLRQTVKEEWSPSRRQWEYVERIFNRLDNSYIERYYDKQTGHLMFEKDCAS